MASSFLNPAYIIEHLGVSEGMRVADFESAGGFFARAAARAVGQGGVVWAVSANRELLKRLKNLGEAEGLANIEIIHGSIEKKGGSGLPDNHFDICLIANALFTAEHKLAVASEAHRILKKGGRVLVVDWKDSFGGLGPHKDHLVSESQVKEIFAEAGFSYERAIQSGYYHFGVILKK